MADLVRTLEADLFGAYAWAAELYQDLLEVEDAATRAFVAQGLMRAIDHLEHEDTADAANRAPVSPEQLVELSNAAAEVLAAAEDAIDAKTKAQLAALAPARDALLEGADVATAQAFLAAFRPAWARGPRGPLVVDAVLAALALSNVVASRERERLQPFQEAALHAEAAEIYDDVAEIAGDRVGFGDHAWADTVAGALNRAARVWRLAGDADRARRAAERAARAGTPG